MDINYHPDVQTGRENVLALMFNMNDLWECFVYKSLKKHLLYVEGYSLQAQKAFDFWSVESSSQSIKPDIIITRIRKEEVHKWILDTKWKLSKDNKPSSSDLQQMYAYAGTLNAPNVALVYPGEGDTVIGNYITSAKAYTPVTCSIIKISIKENIGEWQYDLYKICKMWIERITDLKKASKDL